MQPAKPVTWQHLTAMKPYMCNSGRTWKAAPVQDVVVKVLTNVFMAAVNGEVPTIPVGSRALGRGKLENALPVGEYVTVIGELVKTGHKVRGFDSVFACCDWCGHHRHQYPSAGCS